MSPLFLAWLISNLWGDTLRLSVPNDLSSRHLAFSEDFGLNR